MTKTTSPYFKLALSILINVTCISAAMAASVTGGEAMNPIPQINEIIKYLGWIARILAMSMAAIGLWIAAKGIINLMNQANSQGMHAGDSSVNPWMQVLAGALISSITSVIAVWLFTFDLDVAGTMSDRWGN